MCKTSCNLFRLYFLFVLVYSLITWRVSSKGSHIDASWRLVGASLLTPRPLILVFSVIIDATVTHIFPYISLFHHQVLELHWFFLSFLVVDRLTSILELKFGSQLDIRLVNIIRIIRLQHSPHLGQLRSRVFIQWSFRLNKRLTKITKFITSFSAVLSHTNSTCGDHLMHR